MDTAIAFYHAHIYFNDSVTRAKAVHLQTLISEEFGPRTQVSPLIDRPIGPHPVPMFEVDFRAQERTAVVDFLEKKRDGLSILVHPATGKEVWDHTDGAAWLGERMELNIKFLQDYADGKVAGVHDTIIP